MAAIYSRATLVAMIRDEINEPTPRIFSGVGTDSAALDLDRFVDLGARVCSAITMCNDAETSVALTSAGAANRYKLVSLADYINVESVTHYGASSLDRTGLQRVHPEALGNIVEATAGPPKFYCFFANSLFLGPRMSSSEVGNSDTLTIRGYTVVTSVGNAGSETLPQELQITPFYYGLACAYARLGKHTLSAVNMQQFIAECNQWRYDVHGSLARVDPYNMAEVPDFTVAQQ